MDLEQFRKNRELTHSELASLLKLKRSTAYNICKGVGDVTLANATRVVEFTGGVVGYVDLLKKGEC